MIFAIKVLYKLTKQTNKFPDPRGMQEDTGIVKFCFKQNKYHGIDTNSKLG